MSLFLNPFQGKKTPIPPLWFMRQAGRYLPEYREIRRTYTSFLDLCYSPKDATRVTLQPLERFDLDVAILFSDILVIPDGLGQKVVFKESQGPLLSPLSLSSYSKNLSFEGFFEKVNPVYEAIKQIKTELPPSKTLMGFAGSPWTLALYMLEGQGSRDFAKAKEEAFLNEDLFSNFLDFLGGVIAAHLIEQVKAGAQAVQLFDSWAGLCPSTHFKKWVIDPTQKIVSRMRQDYPDLPIIGFPKGAGTHLLEYGSSTGVSALSLDSNASLAWMVKNLPESIVLQGNLDPLLLVAGGNPLKEAIEMIHYEMKGRPYIFNLGHGVLPQTPPSHVKDCVNWVKALG